MAITMKDIARDLGVSVVTVLKYCAIIPTSAPRLASECSSA
jgi:hypothetical protein